jgi:hypothetical protein
LLRKFGDLLEAGVPAEWACRLSKIEHLTVPQAIELSRLGHPIDLVVQYANEIRIHLVRMRWLSDKRIKNHGDALNYAKGSFISSPARAINEYLRITGD